jgi:ATP phosphoribosyltransferase regulatory subunit
LDLGNVSIVMAVFDWLNLGSQDRSAFFSALQAKDTAFLDEISGSLSSQKRKVIMELPKLYGDVAILDVARDLLSDVPGALSGIGELENLSEELDGSVDQVSFDLAEMRGFQYHSGIVTATYIDGEVSPVSRGGRYDHVGEVFGRSRKATGFTIDLRRLARLGNDEVFSSRGRLISSPRISRDAELINLIKSLREQGDVVIVDLNIEGSEAAESSATHRLKRIDATWQVVSL